MSKKELTEREQSFVREYSISLNASDAAKKAGYSARTADVIAVRLMKRDRVKAAINAIQEKKNQKAMVTIQELIENLLNIAIFNSKTDYLQINEQGDVQEIMKNPNASIRAWELIGKHLGAFTEKLEIKDEDNALNSEERMNNLARKIAFVLSKK